MMDFLRLEKCLNQKVPYRTVREDPKFAKLFTDQGNEYQTQMILNNIFTRLIQLDRGYCRSWLRCYFSEFSNCELCEELADLYFSLLEKNDNNQSSSSALIKQRIVLGGECQNITFTSSRYLISDGTTGLSLWAACMAMCEFVYKQRELIRGKTVVELGCGLGVFSILCGRLDAKRSFPTDFHESVLSLLRENVKLNDLNEDLVVPTILNWESLPETFPNCDIGFCSDVIYDSSLISPLLNAVLFLFRVAKISQLFVFSRIRNENTMEAFQSQLSEMCNVERLKWEPVNWQEKILSTPTYDNDDRLFYYPFDDCEIERVVAMRIFALE